ncbi:hypothetical protein SAMN06295981_1745 [Corynebacterium pollutisoli]|uniref:DUF2269 domain-containing protein n=1 Tax=Corynebacterium pollutisoli TaxID=1610489 RepID=A0A1X7JNB0_9CORY|nr:DUF2269 domain-containing protein [Corynebacterium pollutisoli]SMG28925.1 hypothetical protein SAMN06295981_1745 [Corynebacterium pollutisoli]
MTTILIVFHVLAAVLFLGPVTVAISTFQTQAVKAQAGDTRAAGAASVLHKLTNVYGMLAALVPLLGVGIMMTDSAYWSDGRFHIAITLAVIAWLILLFLIIPRQKKMMGSLGLLDAADHDPESDVLPAEKFDKTKSQLSMFGGIFSLLWVIMLILMYWSPF